MPQIPDYDEDGWRHPAYHNNTGLSRIHKQTGNDG
jgi:hypothetical protein